MLANVISLFLPLRSFNRWCIFMCLSLFTMWACCNNIFLFLFCMFACMNTMALQTWLHPADYNPGLITLDNHSTHCHRDPVFIPHGTFSGGMHSSQKLSPGITDFTQLLRSKSLPSITALEAPSIGPWSVNHLKSPATADRPERHVASLYIHVNPRHQTEARYTPAVSLTLPSSGRRRDPEDTRLFSHSSLPSADPQVVYMFIIIDILPLLT